MSTEAFRAAVVTVIKGWLDTNHPDIDAVYENGPAPDQEQISSPWVDVCIKWDDAENVTTGLRPRGRDYGLVVANVFTREGEGTQKRDQLIDGLRELLRNTRVGGGVLNYPRRSSTPAPLLGWDRAGLQVPFYLDTA